MWDTIPVAYYHNGGTKNRAEKYKAELKTSVPRTKTMSQKTFLSIIPRGKYHQDILQQRECKPLLQDVIRPKLDKFRKVFQRS